MEIWATQLAGTDWKSKDRLCQPDTESAVSYKDVKIAILHRYDVNEEAPLAPISF